MIVPILGITKNRSLADALFTRTQQRVLALLFGPSKRSFGTSEIIRLARTGSGATQRELARLKASGLIQSTRAGNQVRYQANPDSPIFEELSGILAKTVGLSDPVRSVLSPLATRIRAAFIFGSLAKGTDRSSSDIDLMVVADDLTYADLFNALEPLHARLGRPVNPTVYTALEFADRRRASTAFVTRVIKAPKIWILGTEDDLGL